MLVPVQTVEVVEAQEKDGKLQGLLAKHHKSRTNRILIFVLYKKEAARVEAMLHRKGWKVCTAAPVAPIASMEHQWTGTWLSLAQSVCFAVVSCAVQEGCGQGGGHAAPQRMEGTRSCPCCSICFRELRWTRTWLSLAQSVRCVGGVCAVHGRVTLCQGCPAPAGRQVQLTEAASGCMPGFSVMAGSI